MNGNQQNYRKVWGSLKTNKKDKTKQKKTRLGSAGCPLGITSAPGGALAAPPFTEAVPAGARMWSQPKCLSAHERVKKVRNTYTMWHYVDDTRTHTQTIPGPEGHVRASQPYVLESLTLLGTWKQREELLPLRMGRGCRGVDGMGRGCRGVDDEMGRGCRDVCGRVDSTASRSESRALMHGLGQLSVFYCILEVCQDFRHSQKTFMCTHTHTH